MKLNKNISVLKQNFGLTFNNKASQLVHNVSNIPIVVKTIYQRSKYGISSRDCWDLDTYLKTIIENGVKILDNDTICTPYKMTEKEWHNHLQTIVDCMEYINKDMDIKAPIDKMVKVEKNKKELFSGVLKWLDKYIDNLWW